MIWYRVLQKLVGVVVLPGNGESESTIALVSGGPVLQLWRGAELHEHPLRRPLTEAYARTHLAPHGIYKWTKIIH